MSSSSSPVSLLKRWFLFGSSSSSSSSHNKNNHHQAPPLPRILLLDGGVSTHLESLGAAFAHRQLWSSSLLLDNDDSSSSPENGKNVLLTGHKDWIQTGQVNLISTVTYQCHYDETLWPDKRPDNNVICNSEHMDELWQNGVQLAHEAILKEEEEEEDDNNNDARAGRFHGVIASTGCFGAALANGAEYTGDYGDRTIDDLRAFHERKLQTIYKQQNQKLLEGVAIETVPSLAECYALRDLFCKRYSKASSPPLACWISLACRNGHELNDGTPVTTALQVLEEIPVDCVQAFGFNCCAAKDLPSLVNVLVKHYTATTASSSSPQQPQRGIVLYPNSGEIWDAEKQDWQKGTTSDGGCCGGSGGIADESTSSLASLLLACIRQIDDASIASTTMQRRRIIVGGCCRTTPANMAAVRELVDAYLAEQQEP